MARMIRRFKLRSGGPSRMVFSEKAQIWMQLNGVDLSYIEEMAQLRNDYLRARTAENINRISTYELENRLYNS